jgi:hypothetical protein
MAMTEHETEVSITLSRNEIRDILERMIERPRDYVKLTATLYHIDEERAETRVKGLIYGEGPDVEFEL